MSLPDEINNTLSELGLEYAGPDHVAAGSPLVLRIKRRGSRSQAEAEDMADEALRLLLTSPYSSVKDATTKASGVIVE